MLISQFTNKCIIYDEIIPNIVIQCRGKAEQLEQGGCFRKARMLGFYFIYTSKCLNKSDTESERE